MQIEVEAIIPKALLRLSATGEDTIRRLEVTENEESQIIGRRKVVEWVRLAVSILTEYLDSHEKILALSKVMEELKSEKRAPQEIQENENFVEFVEGMCKSLTTNVGSIINENEAIRVLLEHEMAERTKLFE